LLFVGVCEVLEFWATRRKQFWSISSRRIVRSVTQLTVQLGTGVAKQGSAGLIAGTILGQVAETFMLGIQVIRQDIRVLSGSLQRNRMRAVAAEYRDFPVFGVPVSLLGAVSQNVPILMLSAFFGTSTVGLYAMAVRVLLLPADFLTASLRQVFFQRAAEAEAHGMDAFHLFRRASLILAGVVLLPVLVVFLVAPWLFGAVLGSQWREAGEYARWLVLWVAFLVVNVPASAMLQVKKRQKLLLYNAVGLIVARVLAVAVPGLLGNAVAAIAGYALVGVLANGILIFQADRILLAERSSAAVSAHGGPEF
jgi:O-antigen/teichoic acid export membrane protein